MDFSGYLDGVVSFAQNNTVIFIFVALLLLLFLYRRPKLFLGILFFGLLLAVLIHMITSMAGSGLEQKKRLITEEQKQSDNRP